MAIEFRVLGPLEVVRDGVPVQPRSAKQRALLAALILRANEVVAADGLVDTLWGEHPPATAPAVLQTYVSQLRKVLEAGRGTSPCVLLTANPGYRLVATPEQVDAARFEGLVRRGREARREGRTGDAADLLAEGLALWRGAALEDVAEDGPLRSHALRLDELRLVATEDRVEADIALGRHGDLVGELSALVADHPLRERLWGHLMLCLYRVGRQADALAAYQQVRHRLADELGLAPGAPLRELERQILAHAPALEWRPAVDGAADRRRPVRDTVTTTGAPTRLGFPAALAVERRGPLVGRGDARSVVEEAVVAAATGRQAVLVAGEPGIGKSRLVAEVAATAHDAGATVLLGRCVEELIAPFAPWEEALGAVVDVADDRLLRRSLERSGGVLARLFPSLVHRFGELPTPPPADPATERRRLADAIDGLLGDVAATGRLLVVLEDLHWVDEASLAVLAHVLRPGGPPGVVVVGTYRDTELAARHPLVATLATLRRRPEVTRVRLAGLDHVAIAELVTSLGGQEPDEHLVAALVAETAGNPLFAKEVLRHLVDTGAYRRCGDRWVASRPLADIGLPAGVREVVGRRLALLSDCANRILEAAAVIGADVDVALLTAVTGEQVAVLDAVDEVVRAGVLREVPGPPGRCVFSHALIRQTVLDRLSGGHRARAHWQIGEALATLRPDRVDEIAYHLTEGALAGDAGRAVDAAVTAGRHALDRLLPEPAALQFERALVTIDTTALGDPERRWAALLGRAKAAAMALDMDTTIRSCLAAMELAERMGWRERVVEAVIQATETQDSFLGHDELVPIVDRALASATRPVDRIRLLIGRSHLALGRLQPVAARADAAAAMAIAREAGEWSWLLEAIAAYGTDGLPIEDHRELADELLALAARPDVVGVRRVRPLGNYAVFARQSVALRLGDRRPVDAALVEARGTFFADNRVAVHDWDAMLALADGRLCDAEAAARRLTEELPSSVIARYVAQVLRGEVLAERGDPKGVHLLGRLVPHVGTMGLFLTVAITNFEHAWGGDAPDRSDVVGEALRHLDATDPSNGTAAGYSRAAEAAARYGRTDWASQVERKLRALGGVYLSGGTSQRIVPMGRALAQVLLVLGRLDEAVAEAEAAVAADERFGADGLLIRSRQWLATVLLERGRGDDARRARDELGRAVPDARRMGFVVVADECQRLLDASAV